VVDDEAHERGIERGIRERKVLGAADVELDGVGNLAASHLDHLR
jgi:hypothetical protein